MYDITTTSGDFFAGGVLVHNCDAFYTWKRDSVEFWTESERNSFQEVADRVEKLWTCKDGDRRVIWSGGEPLMQRKQIEEIARYYLEDWHHEIETNGTLMPTQYMLDNFQFNCSPKLSNNKDDRAAMRIRPKILEALNAVDTSFKFVCEKVEDLEEIERDYLPHISDHKVIIMPEGVTSEEINHHARLLRFAVLERGWRMTPRFQAQFAHGAERGV